MKKRRKFILISIVPLLAVFFILRKSGGGEVWVGEATTPEEILAKEACLCIYHSAKEKGLEVDRMLGKTEDEIKAEKDLFLQFKLMESMDFAKIPCLRTFFQNRMQAIKEKKFDREKSKEAYKKCRLPIFR